MGRSKSMEQTEEKAAVAIFHEIILEDGILHSDPIRISGAFREQPYRTQRPIIFGRPVSPTIGYDLWVASGLVNSDGRPIYNRSGDSLPLKLREGAHSVEPPHCTTIYDALRNQLNRLPPLKFDQE